MATQQPEHERAVIRPAAAEDADAIASLLGELGYPTDQGSAAARIARLSAAEGSAIFVATRSGCVCALATLHLIPLFHRDSSLARITSFVVTRAAQRSGAGSALLTACEVYARAHGAERLEVTSGDQRPEAHAFYERRGFEREGVRMTRRLTERPTG
jgi:N-acetylglutamate synthase-like GNAT family acetyltransferase